MFVAFKKFVSFISNLLINVEITVYALFLKLNFSGEVQFVKKQIVKSTLSIAFIKEKYCLFRFLIHRLPLYLIQRK